MMTAGVLFANGPIKPHDRGRRCAIWVSPWVRDTAIIDTSALKDGDLLFAGPDTFPPDCLLVVVAPAENHRLYRWAATLPYPIGGSQIAAGIIDARCRDNPELRRSLRW